MTQEKRLLVLGRGTAPIDIVQVAKKMGMYVIAVDQEEEPGISGKLANENYQISTADFNSLADLVKEKQIDGVFCAASERNIVNALTLSEITGLPFYCTRKQWDICSNKASFKELCRKFNVPCVPDFDVDIHSNQTALDTVRYPVIVKPVDGCSSAGLSVCYTQEELKKAIVFATKSSASGKIVVEKYITSDYGFGCRYIANDGEIYLSATNDRYTVDPTGGRAMISAAAIFPSKKIDYYINNINENVIEMFKSIGIKNGTMFMQALYDKDDDQIYFHEMGLRLSGGMIYSMLERTCGYSDLEMMLRYAVGGNMVLRSEINKIDPYLHGNCFGSLCVTLRPGVIKTIKGVDEIKTDPDVSSVVVYYNEGDSITEENVGTLAQHFCRIKMIVHSIDDYKKKVDWIQSTIDIRDEDGKDMIYRRFDTNRMK